MSKLHSDSVAFLTFTNRNDNQCCLAIWLLQLKKKSIFYCLSAEFDEDEWDDVLSRVVSKIEFGNDMTGELIIFQHPFVHW